MLKKFEENKTKLRYDSFGVSELGTRLARLQRIAQSMNIPILIIVDGWESAGKGYVIKDLVRELNPKYFDVQVFDHATEDEEDYPFLHRFWIQIPKKGHVKVFDRSFYYELMSDLDLNEDELKKHIESIKGIEKTLYDDYTVILKLFLHIGKDSQKERIEEYQESESKSFYIDNHDLHQNEHYDEYLKHLSKVLELTDFEKTPWNIICSENMKSASKEALGLAIEKIEEGIERVVTARSGGVRLKRDYVPENKPLDEIDLKKSISDEEYDEKLKDLQNEVADLMLKYHSHGIPTVLVFEGVDAAGKDGAIARLIRYVDPRSTKVHAISSPDQTENSYNYLWRFYTRLPKRGRLGIFSRSWYGRVMVERVEGFAKENEWERAYDEMLQLEKEIYDFGGLVLKYFVVIDQDEQLKRFEAREEDLDKQYKITEEDWRNRDKWGVYIEAMNEMLDRTNVDYAPWVIVEGNDKQYARIKVLETFLDHAKKHYKKIVKD